VDYRDRNVRVVQHASRHRADHQAWPPVMAADHDQLGTGRLGGVEQCEYGVRLSELLYQLDLSDATNTTATSTAVTQYAAAA
jgi:hypothetical protein